MTRRNYNHPQRENSGIVLPEFIIHAALSDLPRKLATGYYEEGRAEEPIVKVVQGVSQELIDQVFESLRRKPPSIGLEFPNDRQNLPAIFVVTETMDTAAPILADDAGAIRPDINTFEGTHWLTENAQGGETEFLLPSEGDLITGMVSLWKYDVGASDPYELDNGYDYTVDAATKTVTLSSALLQNEKLYAAKWGSWGLPGGDLYATTFQANLVIFVDTENPVVTSVLKGLVWLELTLKTAQILSSGLADPTISIRYQSIYDEIRPALGHRAEVVFSCLTSWLAYDRTPIVKTMQFDGYDAQNPDGSAVLEMNFELVRWATDEEAEEG